MAADIGSLHFNYCFLDEETDYSIYQQRRELMILTCFVPYHLQDKNINGLDQVHLKYKNALSILLTNISVPAIDVNLGASPYLLRPHILKRILQGI